MSLTERATAKISGVCPRYPLRAAAGATSPAEVAHSLRL